MPISEELKRIYASAPSDVTYVDTLSFSHSQFTQLWSITNHVKPMRYFLESGRLERFINVPFEFSLPASNTQGNQDLSFAICNVGREIMDEVENEVSFPQEPIQVKYRVYTDKEDTYPETNPPLTLSVTQVSFSLQTITANARRFDMLNYPFPNLYYELKNFPGLRR